MRLTEARRKAQDRVRDAFAALVEARRELTLYELETFIRENIESLGYHGFVGSVGQAFVDAATIESDPAGRAILDQERDPQ